MRRELLMAELRRTVWALEPAYGDTMMRVLARWQSGAPMSDEVAGQVHADRMARDERRRDGRARSGNGSIMLIPVYGVLTQRGNMMDEVSGPGTCSTEQLAAALRSAENDETVGQILMEFDTPGGSVFGLQEASAEINRIKATKPIIGVANSTCASAGYWLLSQCSEAYCTPGGEVGSIGVWMAHEDASKAMEKAGIATTLISAGRYKTEGHPFGPLPADAKGFMQSRIDECYRAFCSAVARGRNVPIETVRSGMGQGRMLGAPAALAEKMIDGVATLPQVVAGMQRNVKPGGGRSALAIDAHGGRSVQAAHRAREIELLSL